MNHIWNSKEQIYQFLMDKNEKLRGERGECDLSCIGRRELLSEGELIVLGRTDADTEK